MGPGDEPRDDILGGFMNVKLYLLQRATAALMVPLIVGHLIVIFYATRKGLSAADILGRTRGSLLWGLYYGLFVLAASIHGSIGVRSVLREWAPRSFARNDRALDLVMWGFGGVLLLLGLRVLVIENLPWRDGQKRMALLVAATALVVAAFFLLTVYR